MTGPLQTRVLFILRHTHSAQDIMLSAHDTDSIISYGILSFSSSFFHSLLIHKNFFLGSSPDQHEAGSGNEPFSISSCGKEDHEEREPPTVRKKKHFSDYFNICL